MLRISLNQVSKPSVMNMFQHRTFAVKHITEAERIRKMAEAEKKLKADLEAKEKKLKQKDQEKEKRLQQKTLDREKKKIQQLEAWKLSEKIKQLKEKEEVKLAKKKSRSLLSLERQKLKEKEKKTLKKLNDLANPKRKKADPNAPKRALTPFLWFYTQNFEILKDNLYPADSNGVRPKIDVKNLMKEAKTRFEALSADEKQKYETLSKDDKARYDRERSAYVNRRKAQKPKRATTPFMIFCNENRDQLFKQFADVKGRQKVTEVGRKLGQMWKDLSEQDKEKYKQQFRAEADALKPAEKQ